MIHVAVAGKGALGNVLQVAVTIGQTIKELRERKGLSQDELAKKAGVTTGFIGHLERWEDRYRNPTIETLEAIAKALEVDVTVLLRGEYAMRALARLPAAPEPARLDEDEEELLKIWKLLSPNQKKLAFGMLDQFVGKRPTIRIKRG